MTKFEDCFKVKKVIVIYGLPGSGKSFFAGKLADFLKVEYLSTDVIRKEIIQQRSYSDQEKNAVYVEMIMLIQRLLSHDKSVVVDGTFYREELRKMVEKESLNLKANVYFIEVVADEAVIKERMNEKRPYSEADFRVYQVIKKQFEPNDRHHLVLDSSKSPEEELFEAALKYIEA